MRNNSGGSGANSRLDARSVCALIDNAGHPHQRPVLAVALGTLAGVFPAALDIVDGLFALDLVDDLGLNGRASNHRRTDHGANHQDVVELDLFTSGGIKLFNAQHVTCLHFVLLATGLEDRKHGSFPLLLRALWPPQAGVRGSCLRLGLRALTDVITILLSEGHPR